MGSNGFSDDIPMKSPPRPTHPRGAQESGDVPWGFERETGLISWENMIEIDGGTDFKHVLTRLKES